MTLGESATLARIFVSEADHHEGTSLHEWVVRKAREFGLAGATVLRGVMGYGESRQVHTNRLVEFSTNQPVVVELVDTPERIAEFLPLLDEAMDHGGLITLERVQVHLHRPNQHTP